MSAVFLCAAVWRPVGRFGEVLAQVHADDLAAIPIRELLNKNLNLGVGQVIALAMEHV